MTTREKVGSRREVWYVAVTDYPRGLGSTSRARSICRALSLAGYHPRLLIPHALGHGANPEARGAIDGLAFEYLNGSPRRPATGLAVAWAKLRGNLSLAARVTRARRSLACLFLYNATLFDCWGALLTARLFGIRTVLDWTDEWLDTGATAAELGVLRYALKRFAKITEAILWSGVDRIIVVSRHLRSRLGSHAGKAALFPVAFNPSFFACAPPARLAPENEFVVLYAGSVSPIEGIEILLDSFRTVSGATVRTTRLFVVGDPAHGETIGKYEAVAGELIDRKLVRFLPTVDQQRYASLLRGADLLVIPRPTSTASTAGFPYKLVEYIASGSPVLVTKFGDVEEYFTDGVHCLMCPPDDPAALASAMRRALEERDRLPALATAGRARVTELFAMESVAARLVCVIADSGDRAS